MRILLAGDEPAAVAMLARGLREQTYAVDVAGDGRPAADHVFSSDNDRRAARPQRLDVCREIRSGDGTTPILMLTALDAVADRVTGLDAGADDYVAQPLSSAGTVRAHSRAPHDGRLELVRSTAGGTTFRAPLPVFHLLFMLACYGGS